MKSFKFPVEVQVPWDHFRSPERNDNGLFSGLRRAYSTHIPITIKPDDVLNTVACIWAKYVLLNAETFREHFVDHQGKEKIHVYLMGVYDGLSDEEFLYHFLEAVKEDSNQNMGWAEVDFTTTEITDTLCRSACMLASQKEYYEYGMTLACGFSEVTLAGTDEDWDSLKTSINSMPTLSDIELQKWQLELLRVINSMLSGDEEFWQSAANERPYGSGSQSDLISGWIKVFNPFNENGDWLETIGDKDVLNLNVDFEVEVNDNGNIFEVEVAAGPDSYEVFENYIRISTSFIREIKEKD